MKAFDGKSSGFCKTLRIAGRKISVSFSQLQFPWKSRRGIEIGIKFLNNKNKTLHYPD